MAETRATDERLVVTCPPSGGRGACSAVRVLELLVSAPVLGVATTSGIRGRRPFAAPPSRPVPRYVRLAFAIGSGPGR